MNDSLLLTEIKLQMKLIKLNHNLLKKENNRLCNHLCSLERKINKKKSFMFYDKEKNYINNLIYILLEETFYKMNPITIPIHKSNEYINKLYKWLIDEEFNLEIIKECTFEDIQQDFTDISPEFWENFTNNVKNYLKYGRNTSFVL